MAAAGTAVTVLTPNGRRQTVKVFPNTPLLQVLEDVCKKHGFNPDDHGLKFQRTVVDLTLPWRFANLPNNAKLEMVTSARKQAVADSQVRIALQMEDGSRLQGSFSCGQSLWELLTHFPQISVSEQCESGSTPVCVYMRDEVSGEEALKKATLKSLGLTGGSAIVRFLLKKTKAQGEEDDREVTETAAIPATPVAKETTPSPSSQPDPAPSHPETSTAEVPTKNSSPHRPMEAHPEPTPASATSKLPIQQEEVPKSHDAVRPKFPPVERGMPEEDGEQAGPSGLNSLSSFSSSSAPLAPFVPFSGGGQRLGGPVGGAEGRSLSSSLSSSSLSALTAGVESPKAKKAKSSYGSNAKRQTTANQPDEDMDQGDEFLEPIEREPLIYHLDSVSRHSDDNGNLPDEFFEVTVDDVRKRFAQLKSERKFLEEAPLMTKSLREAQMKEKMERYPKVVLRVQFPDRHVLQGFFRPLETVGAVRHFVQSHLEDPQLSFYLFITPPKTILDDPSATLFQADLFPGALVYFGSDVKTDFYIKRELRESSVSALQANESIASCMLRSPSPPTSSEEPLPPPELSAVTSGSTQGEQDPSPHTQAAKPARSDPGKVPKWLKLPGKK
ncbi:tether containing UBX domain for GLUT4 isoform X2 [Micropterus dolomieu]|uniref:tether containing UBX domain for GLUT4 isoform X1 n=1 Tax=Micropterus dolomieu TaxID=147949 RepID=UPI001E8ECEA2|nr:tether containing UBX domain for GLUT4 isoform X1 [Micropterus dolomieu]XP_045903478.1 tether containing UBX domain for GLUT4 isoform X2 [Micropterus dolomieu]